MPFTKPSIGEIHIVFGMVNDKDIRGFCEHCRNMPPIILPKQALNARFRKNELLALAEEAGLKGTTYPTVVEAVQAAKELPPKI